MPKMDSDRHFSRIEVVLKRIILRLKLLLALEFLLQLAALFLILFLGSLCIEASKEILPYLPFAYSLLALSSMAAALILGIRKAGARVTVRRTARGLEQEYEVLKDDVTNALLLFDSSRDKGAYGPASGAPIRQANAPMSNELIAAHLKKTADQVSKIHPDQAVTFRKLMPHIKFLVLLALAFSFVAALDSKSFRSMAFIFNPISALPERDTFIAAEPRSSVVLKGTSVAIDARVSGYIPERLSVRLWPEGGNMMELEMASEREGRFAYRIPSAQSSFRYQAFSGRNHSPVYNVAVAEAPDIERIRLALIPPAYTRLKTEFREKGHIEALKGTVVNLEALATKPVKEAALIVNGREQHLPTVEGSRLSGDLLVLQPGTYSISIEDALGFKNEDPVRYTIRLIPDRFPEATIVKPAENLEVTGNEVLPVVYSAEDDFGVASIRLIYQIRGVERALPLKRPAGNALEGPQRFDWDLSNLSLIPGDRVSYRIEVWDNDTVSGPKAGYSETFTLQMPGERRAAREAERLERIAAALLNLLADQLEALKDRPSLADEIAKIMSSVRAALQRMGAQKLERLDLEALEKNLDALYRRIDRLPDETVTQEMERLALLAEDLMGKTRMQEVEALSREIKNRQQRLIDTLRDRKGDLLPETLESLLKELDQLKDLISKVMEALSKTASQLPDEFINSPELSELEFQNLFRDLEEMRQRLTEGDLSAAMKAAQRLLQNLTEMMAAMSGASLQRVRNSHDRLQSEMSRKSNELEKILEEQKEILSGTERVKERMEAAGASTSEPEAAADQEGEEAFPGLSSRQGTLQQKTRELSEALKMLSQLFPGMDSEILDDLENAAGSMGQASGSLAGKDAPGAIPPEQAAIRSLSRSQQSMEQMAQQAARQMQANRMGAPWGYDPRAGWYWGPHDPMPTLPQPEFDRPLERGFTGFDREEFDPPAKESYKAPPILRERVMEALKEEVPSVYRQQVEKYFKGLTQ